MSSTTSYGCLILTGGGSTRMGVDKAQLDWLGTRAVDRVLEVAKAVVGGPTFTVGCRDYGLPFIPDDEPGAGPVGGIIKGCSVLRSLSAPLALVLAVDAPTITPKDLEPLVRCGPKGAAYAAFHLPMLLPLIAVPSDASAGWPVARLIDRANLCRPPCPHEARQRVRGANTPEERAALMSQLQDRNDEHNGPLDSPVPP